MHLTNYAIQKRSDDFVRDEDSGTKRYDKDKFKEKSFVYTKCSR